MPDTLTRLVGPVQLAAAAAIVYTAPADSVVTIRQIHVVDTDPGPVTFRMSIGADAAGTRVFHDMSVAPGTPFDWSGTIVLAAGETLRAYASAAASLTLTISGVVTT